MSQKATGLVNNSSFELNLVGWLEVRENRRFPQSTFAAFLVSLLSMLVGWSVLSAAKRKKKKKTDLVI